VRSQVACGLRTIVFRAFDCVCERARPPAMTAWTMRGGVPKRRRNFKRHQAPRGVRLVPAPT